MVRRCALAFKRRWACATKRRPNAGRGTIRRRVLWHPRARSPHPRLRRGSRQSPHPRLRRGPPPSPHPRRRRGPLTSPHAHRPPQACRLRPAHRRERERQAWRSAYRRPDCARAPRRERAAHAQHRRGRGLAPDDRSELERRAASSRPAATARPSRSSTRSTASSRRASPFRRSAPFRSAPATHGLTRSALASSTPASVRSRDSRGARPDEALRPLRPAMACSPSSAAAAGTRRCSTTIGCSSSRRRRTASRRACGATSRRCSRAPCRRRSSTAART